MAVAPANRRDGAGGLSKASQATARSFYHREQRSTHASRGKAVAVHAPTCVHEHQSDARFLLPRCVRQRVCLILPRGHTRAFSVQVSGANRSPAQPVSDEPLQQLALSEVLNHPKRLSSTDLDGIDPNEIGFDACAKVLCSRSKSQ